jgi:catalase-peroxidase
VVREDLGVVVSLQAVYDVLRSADRCGPGTNREWSAKRLPTMLTTDLSLRVHPIYEPIARRFLEHPDELQEAFAKAGYKLIP